VENREKAFAMKKISKTVIESIGDTPMIQLHKSVPQNGHKFFAKVEYFNPGGSVKDRIALAIIEDAEKRGLLKPGGTIVEATSGNTGVGLGMVAALKGYKCVFVMPEKISEEKRATLRAYGAKVVITPTGVAPDDPNSHYSVCARIVAETPGAYNTNQYHNPANTDVHYRMTGPEIWNQTDGTIDVFVGGAGTGGTLSGVGKFLKEKKKDVKIVCADPYGSILHDMFYYKEVRSEPKSYLVEGIGEDMMPENVQLAYYDDFVQINDQETMAKTREIARTEGLLVGPSCGAALVAAIKYSESGKLKKPSNIIVLFPDGGRSYLSKVYDDNWMRTNKMMD
jgi:cystathionine beta-synthase